MSETCKLCTQSVKDDTVQAFVGERNELLQLLFEKFQIKYEAENKLCTACTKNLKAMNFVLNRWQQAHAKARVIDIEDKTANTNAAEEVTTAATAERPITRTLLKKRAVAIAKEWDKKSPKASTDQTLKDVIKLKSEKIVSPLECLKTEIKESLELLRDDMENVKYEVVPLDDEIDESDKKKSKKTDTSTKPKVKINKEKLVRVKAKKIQTIACMDDDGQDESNDEQIEPMMESERKRHKIDPDYQPEAIESTTSESGNEGSSKLQTKTNRNSVNGVTLMAVIRGAHGGKVAQLFEDNKKERQEESTHWYAVCANCQDEFRCLRVMQKHLKTHQTPYFECEECLESYESIEALQQHQQSLNHVGICTADDDDKKMLFFECVHCEKIFLEHYNMVRHYREVHVATNDRYKCSQCGACFKYKISLQEHLAKHMNLNLNTITCTHCDKTFKNNYTLNRHMLIHTGEQPHQCEECQKRFRHRANLIVHMRTHTGELPFKCKNCTRGFSTSTHMRRHYESCIKRWMKNKNKISRTMVTLKEDELQFNAQKSTKSEVVFTLNTQKIINDNQSDSLLKRSFVRRQKPTKESEQETLTSSTVKQEASETPQIIEVEILTPAKRKLTDTKMKTASLKMPARTQLQIQQPQVHKCKHCNKGYTQRSALDRHMRTHTGERPYRCTQCTQTFADPSNFKRHKLSHSLRNEANNENIQIEFASPGSPVDSNEDYVSTEPEADANEATSVGSFRIVSLNEM